MLDFALLMLVWLSFGLAAEARAISLKNIRGEKRGKLIRLILTPSRVTILADTMG